MDSSEGAFEDLTWEIQGGQTLSTLEVYRALQSGSLAPSSLSRSGEEPWQCLSERFQLVAHHGLLRAIGRGRLGLVFLALDLDQTGRKVALKTLAPAVLGRLATNIARELRAAGVSVEDRAVYDKARATGGEVFAGEAKASRRLAGLPGLVTVLDHNVQSAWISYEYCPEGLLAARLARPYNGADLLRWSAAAAVLLRAAHARDPAILHSELGPGNLLMRKDQLAIAGFGLAPGLELLRSLGAGGGQPEGPRYRAPEQSRGRLTPATDVWALGSLLHELHSGKPAGLDSAETATNLKPRSGDGEARLLTVIQRCLEREPQRRPSMAQVHDALRGLEADAALCAAPMGIHAGQANNSSTLEIQSGSSAENLLSALTGAATPELATALDQAFPSFSELSPGERHERASSLAIFYSSMLAEGGTALPTLPEELELRVIAIAEWLDRSNAVPFLGWIQRELADSFIQFIRSVAQAYVKSDIRRRRPTGRVVLTAPLPSAEPEPELPEPEPEHQSLLPGLQIPSPASALSSPTMAASPPSSPPR